MLESIKCDGGGSRILKSRCYWNDLDDKMLHHRPLYWVPLEATTIQTVPWSFSWWFTLGEAPRRKWRRTAQIVADRSDSRWLGQGQDWEDPKLTEFSCSRRICFWSTSNRRRSYMLYMCSKRTFRHKKPKNLMNYTDKESNEVLDEMLTFYTT